MATTEAGPPAADDATSMITTAALLEQGRAFHRLDAAFARIGLRRAAAGSRSLEDRIGGARRRLRRQALCLALQLATMVVAAGLLALE